MNSTGFAIDVYTYERNPKYAIHLEPGASITQGWPDGWGPKETLVIADDANGVQLFCVALTQQDLDQLRGRVAIQAGVNLCPKP